MTDTDKCCALCSIGCTQRGHIRKKYGLPGGGCGDCMRNWCCPCCSVIQQYREVEKRRDMHPTGPVKVGYQQQQPMYIPQR